MQKELILIIVGTGILMQGCKNNEINQPPPTVSATSPIQKQTNSNPYIGLRNLVWSSNPDSLGLTIDPKSVYCIILDMGFSDETVASLVVIADGTTSMYFSSGGGIIGAGQHEQVRAASTNLLNMIPNPPQNFKKTDTYLNNPNDSHARFYVLTRDGKYASDEFNTNDAANGNGIYSKLFQQANNVVTAIRESSPN